MCYSKPGPRCSDHATKTLTRVTAAYESNPTDENKKKLDDAQNDYDLTPVGIKAVREAGVTALTEGRVEEGVELVRQADDLQDHRDELIQLVEAKARQTNFVASLVSDIVADIKRRWNELRAGFFESDAETLAQLSQDENESVRAKVAANERTPLEVFTALASDEDETVRASVAGNPSTPTEVLTQLASDESESVLEGLVYNTATPAEVLAALGSRTNGRLKSVIVHNPSTPADTLRQLHVGASDDQLRLEGLAGNPNTPADVIDKLWTRKPSVAVREKLASNPSVSPELLRKLSQSGHPRVRQAIAWNRSTPADVSQKLALDENEDVRVALAVNPATPTDTLSVLISDPNTAVRFYVAEHENTSNDALKRLSKDKSRDVRLRASQFVKV